MKATQSKHTKTHPQKPNKRNDRKTSDESLEQIAEELTDLAQRRLPDGVLQGMLRGHEGDIRQKAILLALKWHLNGGSGDPEDPADDWHAPRAIAGALQIIKRDTIKELLDEADDRQRLPPCRSVTCHPVMVRTCDWPTSVMRDLCRRAIRVALSDGRISPLNAAVAESVYVDGIHASVLARRRGVHRSSIYQHLSRTQPHLRHSIETMEVAFEDVM